MSNLNQASTNVGSRTLLLSPPGLSSHPEALNAVVAAHDRNATDIQMLDRLSVGLVKLPESTYDVIMILTDADGTRKESSQLLGRDTLQKVVQSLKAGGRLRSQDQTFGKALGGEERREAILAGLVWDETGEMVKPDSTAIASVPLRLGKKPASASHQITASTAPQPSLPPNQDASGKSNVTEKSTRPAGVGFVDFSDDLDMNPLDMDAPEDDDELIDEDTLLDEADLARPIIQPAECRPKAGKRRRACKDCTCGLKEKIEAEDSTKRANADKALSTIKLAADELAEVDFTVQGKVGSCGNCSLGDAFRCGGCPYIGLPAFKPGDEVRLLNDEAQL